MNRFDKSWPDVTICGKIRLGLARYVYTRQELTWVEEIWGYLPKFDMVRRDSPEHDRTWRDLTGYDMMGGSLIGQDSPRSGPTQKV